jgi:hypothetical protein
VRVAGVVDVAVAAVEEPVVVAAAVRVELVTVELVADVRVWELLDVVVGLTVVVRVTVVVTVVLEPQPVRSAAARPARARVAARG